MGQLGTVLNDVLSEKPDVNIEPITDISEYTPNCNLLVHCRKVQDSIQEVIDYCQATNTTLINLSTGLDYEVPEDMDFTMIDAPNIALRVLEFMIQLEDWSEEYKSWEREIVEHHQESKGSLPGTAAKMAVTLFPGASEEGFKKASPQEVEPGVLTRTDQIGNKITSIRDWKQSKEEFDIPEENKAGYGIHKITFKNPNKGGEDVVKVIKVFGRDEYAECVNQMSQALSNPAVAEKLKNKLTNIVELVREGLHEIA